MSEEITKVVLIGVNLTHLIWSSDLTNRTWMRHINYIVHVLTKVSCLLAVIYLVLMNSLLASREFGRQLMTFANNLDPDEAPQNMGLHLRSKLFEGSLAR